MAIDEEVKCNKSLYKMVEKNLKSPISIGAPIFGAVVSPISNFLTFQWHQS